MGNATAKANMCVHPLGKQPHKNVLITYVVLRPRRKKDVAKMLTKWDVRPLALIDVLTTYFDDVTY